MSYDKKKNEFSEKLDFHKFYSFAQFLSSFLAKIFFKEVIVISLDKKKHVML